MECHLSQAYSRSLVDKQVLGKENANEESGNAN